jgi:hypothetical protein
MRTEDRRGWGDLVRAAGYPCTGLPTVEYEELGPDLFVFTPKGEI